MIKLTPQFLDEDNVDTICHKCVKLLDQSDRRKAVNDSYAKENQLTGTTADERDEELFEHE